VILHVIERITGGHLDGIVFVHVVGQSTQEGGDT
jgi:hypothetical protein